MGIFKKLANKVLNHYSDKRINESGLTAEQKAEAKAAMDKNISLISDTFEDQVEGGAKATLAFVGGFVSGGPIAAFGAGITTGLKESQKAQQKFIEATLAAGIPISVNGELILPAEQQQQINLQKQAEENVIFNAKAIGFGVASFVLLTTLIIALPGSKNSK